MANQKPLALSKKHLTKEEIRQRTEGKITTGSPKFACPEYVESDPIAFEKWQECLKIYSNTQAKKLDIFSSGDVGHLAMYCKTFSQYMDLLEKRRVVSVMEGFSEEEEEEGQKTLGRVFWGKLNFLLTVQGLLSIDKALNQKISTLIHMQDRLFLNPLAKIRNTVQTAPKAKRKPPPKPTDQFDL